MSKFCVELSEVAFTKRRAKWSGDKVEVSNHSLYFNPVSDPSQEEVQNEGTGCPECFL